MKLTHLKLRPLAAKTSTLVLLVHLINFLGGSSSDPLKVKSGKTALTRVHTDLVRGTSSTVATSPSLAGERARFLPPFITILISASLCRGNMRESQRFIRRTATRLSNGTATQQLHYSPILNFCFTTNPSNIIVTVYESQSGCYVFYSVRVQ